MRKIDSGILPGDAYAWLWGHRLRVSQRPVDAFNA